jgi:hypothetical protein
MGRGCQPLGERTQNENPAASGAEASQGRQAPLAINRDPSGVHEVISA